jgi:hypothetical protein
MRPGPTAPCSLAGLLAEFRPCFTAPTFQTFIGLIAQTRRRTVCGMLTGAGLDQGTREPLTGLRVTAAAPTRRTAHCTRQSGARHLQIDSVR